MSLQSLNRFAKSWRMRQQAPGWIAVALLITMFGFMRGPAWQDSATVDETTFLSAGYADWNGYRYLMVPEHPPLAQMLPAVPLLFMDLKISPNAQALLDGRAGYPWTRPWMGPIRAWQELFPQGRDNWYFWALPESQLFGQLFVYDGTNNGQAMLFRGRLIQILLALSVGAVIFIGVRAATGNGWAALVGMACWTFNPNALAHGHLVTTDIGVTLGITVAVLLFAQFLTKPSKGTAVALLMKLTAVLLAPIYLGLAVLHWRSIRSAGRNFWKLAGVLVGAAWVVLMLVYFPRWMPPPALPAAQAQALGVPGWFNILRPLLIPADLFKSLGLTLGHSREGHDAYFLGEWSQKGWLGYYPATFFLKSSLAFVLATVVGLGLFARQWKATSLQERAAWLGAGLFFLFAMTSHVNIGIRHILPVLPLVCVGIGCAAARLRARLAVIAAGILIAWQAVVAGTAYPCYLQFFSEAVGGAPNGYRYLADSNLDWGQDANRLKEFLDARGITHIYLNYFGTQYSIENLKIPNDRVSAEQARHIKQGVLVVSASEWLRPDWAWLRETHQPLARVANTLLVYQLP